VDESTGEGTGEGGDRGRAKGAMEVRDKAGKGRDTVVEGVRSASVSVWEAGEV
jgi:hypothetical protein